MESLFEKGRVVVILDPDRLFYFSGYRNPDAAMLLTEAGNFYCSDARVKEEASACLPDGIAFVDADRGNYLETLLNLSVLQKSSRIGYEGDTVKMRDYLKIDGTGKPTEDVSVALNALRAVKSKRELRFIVKAQGVTDTVFGEVVPLLREGVSEREIAAAIHTAIAQRGGELAFDTIVAFGENTAKPHAHPSDRVLRYGDPVTLDFGAKIDGYCSDMTRSLCLGTPSARYAAWYGYVLQAQELALKGVRAGMTGAACDEIARSSFRKEGLEPYFIHSLGHSLGIAIHESPVLSPRETQVIPAGAVLSVEPGLYLPGVFGIRIEDIVVFENNGADNLTKSPKHLIIL